MSPVHQVWPKLSCKAQWKGEEDKADRGRGGQATSRNGQAWSSPSPRGQWRTGKNGGNWLQNHLLCSNDPRGKGIDEMMMRDVSILLQFASLYDSRECNISCVCLSDYKLSFTRCSQTGHRDKYTQLSLLLLRHWWHRHRMISKLMMHVLTLNPQRRNAVKTLSVDCGWVTRSYFLRGEMLYKPCPLTVGE